MDAAQASIRLDGHEANAFFGGWGADGRVDVRNQGGHTTIQLQGSGAAIRCGGALGEDGDGDILLFPSGPNVDINNPAQATIHLDGGTGDIILRNADCAEEFSVSNAETIQPGMVMVLNDQGLLQPSKRAYDKRVVGVVSGAGNYRPGITLDKQPSLENREPIALVGKVFCQVTAETAPIEVGDLLTTANIPGHAMKATDPGCAFGAVMGKALQSLSEGRGLIPILVALQ
jgi:hypothetical protein